MNLSKGEKGKHPTSVHVPLNENDVKRIEEATQVFKPALEQNPTEGEWEDVDVYWLKDYDDPLTAWLKVVSTPDNSYLLELGKKGLDDESENVKAEFTPTENLHRELRSFFEEIKSNFP